MAEHMRVTARDYQDEALARVADRHQAGVRRLLGVAATGLGKTVIFCLLAMRMGGRALVVAHRDELILQAVAKVLEVWPELGATQAVVEAFYASDDERLIELARRVRRSPTGVGIVKAGANDVRARVVVASVQTLARPKRLAQLVHAQESGGVLSSAAGPIQLVVVDEAHHATAASYRAILDGLGCGEGQGPLLLGVTATPERADGVGLLGAQGLFDELAFSYDIQWGIRAGYLADLRGRRIEIKAFDLDAVRIKQGDFDQGQAGRLMEKAGAAEAIAKGWARYGEGRKTIVFTPTIAVAAQVAEAFARSGVAAAHISGETPGDDRRRLLARFKRGEITVMANCGVLTEGFDDPAVACIAVARPTRSTGLYTQMIGRGTRRHPEKPDCLVLDFVGASKRHSLVTMPSLFGIRDPKAFEKTGETVTAALGRQDEEDVRLGRIQAEEADLFKQTRRRGIAWVPVHKPGEPLKRYHRPLPKVTVDGREVAQPTVVLAQRVEGEDVWTAGLLYENGAKDVLHANDRLELAQGVAEDYCRRHGGSLVSTTAAWRAKPPSTRQLAAAKKWGVKVDPEWRAGELSDAISARAERARARKKKKKAG